MAQASTVQPLIDDPALAEILRSCGTSTQKLAQVFFRDKFFRPFGPIHDTLFQLLDDPEKRKVVIIAPRGMGKTSIVGCAFPAKKILYREAKHIVYISKTQNHAVSQTENLKYELTSNPLCYKIFGEAKSDSFAKEEWITASGTKVVPRGAGQQVRGLNFRGHRPDLWIVDDLEDDKLVLNEEYRKFLWEWFNSALMGTIDYGLKNWKVVVIGSFLHEKSVLAQLMDDPSWTTLVIDICDDNYNSNWPEYMTTEEVRQKADEYRKRGQADLFAREYRSKAIATDSAHFKANYFQYYNEGSVDKKRWETVVLVDPAKTITAKADYSAIVVLSIDADKPAIYVRHVFLDRVLPDELYKETARLMLAFGTHVVGLEVNSLNEFIRQPFINYLVQMRIIHEFVELKPRGREKNDRVGSMVSYYKMRHVYHNDNGTCKGLEDQLLSFPRSKYIDAADAMSYFVEMLELGGRYFQPKEATKEELEAEYLELDREEEKLPAFDGWRYI